MILSSSARQTLVLAQALRQDDLALPKVLFERMTRMIKVAVRTLALLFMWQLAACATQQVSSSLEDEGFSASASDYANAIMAGMERARAMRELRLQSSIAH
ncbi:hypothetical protein EBE87_01395 [Pseudoroseomonas wenyumeiae]|uniref:Uncharacterized protein n=1 Tax=Teichococcus wenyumeiae TaxID=2478470 RepID=A0A3A9JG85_9PROT|nr:hypothetical protein [Pseudoroseomonas wenyumeiae]RKK03485.1 hypothetical protein D6Z83_14360 [Pseudoroseomonas wenyumeiae]RMI27060.1 hypothetical protein EBE87_01395 [Pseudoroseomonas wenyumeiae]